MHSYSLFFELIRIAIDKQKSLSRVPTADEWGELYAMAKKQSLVGVCFAGVQKLHNNNLSNHLVPEQSRWTNLSDVLYLQWMGMAAKIQQRNEVLNRQCVDLQKRLSADGITSAILKGQGVAALYHTAHTNLSMLRQSGDIDIWVDCSMQDALVYAEKACTEKCKFDYKNLHWPIFPDSEVEMHYRVDVLMDVTRHRTLQRFWKEHRAEIYRGTAETSAGVISTPALELNLFYLLLHCYRHLFEGGVGLRQVMDYYFALISAKDMDKTQVRASIKKFGMLRFANGLMWVLYEVFGMDERYMICEPDAKEGRIILTDIMCGGNFGHHDERIKAVGTSKRMRYLSHQLQHGAHLLLHYPHEVISTPIWLEWHWCWKRYYMYRMRLTL